MQPGQTLYAIARTYGLDSDLLRAVNSIGDPDNLQAGVRLWIPGAQRVLYVAPVFNGEKEKTAKNRSRGEPETASRPPVKNYLDWPVKGGTVSSTYGMREGRKHEGLDIAADKGTPIHAAAEGKVMFSGWGPTGYGRMLIIKHPKHHLSTLYAHTAVNKVEKDDYVRQGQVIAEVGETGRATGPHLHFEVRNDTHPKDPLKYLPD